MTGTKRPPPAWEPEALPLEAPDATSRRTRRPGGSDAVESGERDAGERDERAGSHVVVIDIG